MWKRVLHPTAAMVIGLLMLVGCSDDDESTGGTTTTVEPGTSTSSSAEPGSTSTEPGSSSTVAAGCPDGHTDPPNGAEVGETVDVDGDGTPDEVWIARDEEENVTVGINTAAGGGATIPFDSASPVTRAVLVADADETAPVEIFLSDGRAVQLHAFVDCSIVPVTNQEGVTYEFSLGFTGFGTGVGCVDLGDGQQLVGLNVDSTEDDGATVNWSRTVVELNGTEARNGDTDTGTFHAPEDDDAIELLHSVTCGDLTLLDDGVSLAP